MRTYQIPHWMSIQTPPEEQGQIVTSGYAVDLCDGVVVRRTEDRSDRSVAWEILDLSDDEMTDLEDWCAANGAPDVGGEWEAVEVVEA